MIQSIRLKNFRKHENLTLEFDPKFNLLHGRNNSGKTTIFYAIEYCLFGGVRGFKKIAQLAKFQENAVGVELKLKGKDGNIYKLQRMHKLEGEKRSANGFFTLKKIISDDKEKYVLASDFGNREEELSLKLLEILGISKRFFETGIHFAQGEISDIITGDRKLDIVFGIKTATALSNIFRRRALDFEKEVKVLDTFEAIIKQAKQEKKEYQTKLKTKQEKQNNLSSEIDQENNKLTQLQDFKNNSEAITEAVKLLEAANKKIEGSKIKLDMIKKELEETREEFGSMEKLESKYSDLSQKVKDLQEKIKEKEEEINQFQENVQKNEKRIIELTTLQKQKKDLLEEKDSLLEDYDSKKDLEERLEKVEAEHKELNEILENLEKDLANIQQFFRTIEGEKGNIHGILERRKSNKGKPKCIYCGQPIDASKISSEIEEYQSKLKNLQEKIKAQEKRQEKLEESISQSREAEKDSYEEYIKINNTIKKINELEDKITNSFEKDIGKQLKKANIDKKEQTSKLEQEKQNLASIKEEYKKKEKRLNEVDSLIKRNEKQNKKLEEIQKEEEKAEGLFAEKKEDFVQLLETIKDKLNKYLKGLDDGDPFIKPLQELIKEIENYKKNQSYEAATQLREHFNELIIQKLSETSSTLKHLEEQKTQLLRDLEEIKKQIKRLDKKIASNEKKVQILRFKEKLAEKYRNFQEIFKDTQEIIRNNVSTALEERILDYHRLLSSEDEFESIHIDNEDYSLSITPKGMDPKNYYPAWVYEGGGYKLLLGLSYKLSLSELISKSSFLLIDEPTEFIDANNRENLLSNISSLAETTQVILITHQNVDKIECDNKIELKK
jgi:exonuclease SbcC